VISKNLHRRHLDPTQRGLSAARAREFFDERAKKRQGTRTDIPETLPEGSPGDARDEAGEAFGVSGKQVDKASKVLPQGAKPLVEACEWKVLAAQRAIGCFTA